MTGILDSCVSLVWWLALHVFHLVHFTRFCLILLFGDLSTKTVLSPGPTTPAQEFGNNVIQDDVESKSSSDATISTPSDTSSDCSSTVGGDIDTSTLSSSEPLDLPQNDQDATCSTSVEIVKPHAPLPSTHVRDIQMHLLGDPGYCSEKEECKPDPSRLRLSHQQSNQDLSTSEDETSEQLPLSDLHSVVPCWDLDHVLEEGACPGPSVVPPGVGDDVALKVIDRVRALLQTFQLGKYDHRLMRALHLLAHVVPILSLGGALGGLMFLQACRHLVVFHRKQDFSLLDQWIKAFQIGLGLQAWGPTFYPLMVLLSGIAYRARYQKRGKRQDLDHAIAAYKEVLQQSPGSTRSSEAIVQLGDLLLERHRARGSDCDLNDAIHLLEEALSLLADDDPERPFRLSNLSTYILSRYDKLGNFSDVEKAIVYCTEALSILTLSDPEYPHTLNHLATALLFRYQKLGNVSDVEASITHFRESLSLLPSNHPIQAAILTHLASTLITRFWRLGNISDVDEAIVHNRKALRLLPVNHKLRLLPLHNLAACLFTRYHNSGNISDVEETIVHYREILLLSPKNDQGRRSCLSNLSCALFTRYKTLGHPSDSEEAILHCREALTLLVRRHPERPGVLSNLANGLLIRYERSGGVSNLEEGARLLREALEISHPDNPTRPSYIYNLANLLYTRYERMNDVDALDSSISLYKEALTLQPSNHPDRPKTLQFLGIALAHRARDASGVVGGMLHLEESLRFLPSHSPSRRIALYNFLTLSNRLLRPNKTGLARLRDRCAELAKLTPPQHPYYSSMTTLAAPILHACHETASELLTALGIDPGLNAEDATLALLQKGSRSPVSPSRDQLQAVCDWITLPGEYNRSRTLEMYGLMLEHLDLAVARGSSLDTRRRELSDDVVFQKATKLVAEAVAFALKQGSVETAVEFFERGRSILLAQLSLYRVSSGLQTVAPDLAHRFETLSRQLECATLTEGRGLESVETKHPCEDSISRSDRIRREWEQVVEEIRVVEGFDNFLRPTPFADLQKSAAEGPIILINISEPRSDAIIVTHQHSPQTVPLPLATPAQIEGLVRLFSEVADSHKVGSNARDALRSLWEHVVELIVLTLEAMPDVPKRSRIWWCPTGAVTTLPLHAAGDYYGTKGRRIPDLYVSSYTSTLTALCRARQNRSGRVGVPNVLLVGQSQTPGLSSLPAVPDEIARVKARIPHATVIEDERGTRKAVLSAVSQHPWIHLSCHGNIDREDPLQTHFALQDGPLTLLDLMQNRLHTAELAFLSCCHSASGKSKIPDEFLHLAAGMQFAGFKSVVGTMWEMNDAVGPMLADEFYRLLLGRGKGDYQKSAKALSDALKVLRAAKVPAEIWINFVHWGV